jgi:RHS repeat-associated protein
MRNLQTGIHTKPSSHFGAFSSKCTKGKKLPLKSYTITYLFGFNGQVSDNEINGTGNDYDFDARILDSRLGRWLSCDPKASKYPSESPYNFVSNSPLICLDPDGEEKIVITGGADLHNKNRMNFIMASKVQLNNYLNEVKQANSKEKVSWLIFDLDYTPDEKKQFAAYAKANGISAPIFVKSAIEVKNYLNSQNTKAQNLSDERKNDQVTDVSAFSHGIPSSIAFGYENTDYDMLYVDKTDFTINVATKLDKGAFAKGCEIDIYSCNSATPEANLKQDFPSRDLMIKSALTLPNLVTEMSKATGQTVTGYIGRTNYLPVAQGKLPSAGKTGGDNSPRVNGKSIPSVKLKATNGKTKTY